MNWRRNEKCTIKRETDNYSDHNLFEKNLRMNWNQTGSQATNLVPPPKQRGTFIWNSNVYLLKNKKI